MIKTLLHTIFNSLPKFKGKWRLARLLIPNQASKISFKTKSGIKYLVPNLIENVAFELYVDGIYEMETIDYICNFLPTNGVFIDVGANIGAICIEVAYRRPDVTVYAFEAAPSVFQYLNDNKNSNGLKNLEVYNLAIHERGGESLPFYSPKELNGKGSFAPVFTSTPEMVTTVRLDDFIIQNQLRPDFIKIDVEGFEVLILKSMSSFLKENTKCEILFEFVDWAEMEAGFEAGLAQQFFKKLGYQLFRFSDQSLLKDVLNKGFEMISARKPEMK